MSIEKIIYNTARGLLNLDDKLSISTIFIFCYKKDSELFAELLYTNNHQSFIKKLNRIYSSYQVDFSINLKDKNINDAFLKTLEKVRKEYDDNGYFKALFEKDEFAVVIANMIKNDLRKMEFKKILNSLAA
ncbi:hypothetical protein SYJ56_08020 [Algoriphagus sp. D3-2-R+10]|uniref:hypothetical protein n=1 Tax=Algoriphagus aurantiacus TaxID=3103948 RepID=UPI002B3EF030|nr:hypothetical protein [Algoriphagus sp. D3-2-R+10]MEB2775251.1 hypothetical protein [Algoriphagus sp. D3-2-R+10]